MASNNRGQQRHLIRYDMAKLKNIAVKKVYQDRIQTWCQNHDMTTCEANITDLAKEILKEERSEDETVCMITNVLK